MSGQPVDSNDMAWMRATAEEHLVDVASIYPPIKEADGKGGRTVTYDEDPSDVLPARLAPPTQQQRTLMEAIIRSPETEILSLPYGTVLLKDTKVVLASGVTVTLYAIPRMGYLSTLTLALALRINT